MAGDPRSRFVGRLRRRGPLILCLLALGAILSWTGVFDFLDRSELERAEVEQAALSILARQGVGASRVECPGGLEEDVGARVVCTYVDSLSDVVGKAVLGADSPPPRTGRVEVRVSGIDRRTYGPRAGQSISSPELSVKVVRSAR